MERIIILVDFDYYYAQIEERDNPEYRGKPLVVCVYSGRSEDSGAVATCNYQARELGIKAGMPITFAKRRATEETIFVPMRKDYYVQISDTIMDVMRSFADRFEQVSVDEAYLDITESSNGRPQEAVKICRKLKAKVRDKFELTCSIGMGPNKLVAKMSAGMNKPDGLTITRKEEFSVLFHELEVKKLHGIGPKTQEVLEKNGLKTIGDLARFDVNKLKHLIGDRKGELLHDRANGLDNDPVEEREKQQLSNLKTLKEDSRDIEKIMPLFHDLCVKVKQRVDERGIKFKTVSITAINNIMQTKTRSKTLEKQENTLDVLESIGLKLLKEYLEDNPDELIRRIGIGVANFYDEPEKKKQQSLGNFLKS